MSLDILRTNILPIRSQDSNFDLQQVYYKIERLRCEKLSVIVIFDTFLKNVSG